ncbi:MAG: ABC transporter ATP-binding protein, partial [Clostridia bacterium]|nr:ABC transporter ATP-binding protein [Clostridia bacterium]
MNEKKLEHKTKKILWFYRIAVKHGLLGMLVYFLTILVPTGISFALTLVNRSVVNELAGFAGLGVVSSAFIGLVIAYMVLYFTSMLSGYISSMGYHLFSHKIEIVFRQIFFWKAVREEQVSFLDKEYLDRYSFVNQNTWRITQFYISTARLLFSDVATLIGSLTLFALYEPWLLLFAVLVFGASFLVNRLVAKMEYALDKKETSDSRHYYHYRWMLTAKAAGKELRVYKLKDFLMQRWYMYHLRHHKERLKLSKKQNRLHNLQRTLRVLLRIGGFAILVAGIVRSRYDVGTFVLLYGLIESCNAQLDNLSQQIIAGFYQNVKYMCDYYDFVHPIDDKEITHMLSKSESDASLAFGEFESLCVKGATFSYPNSEKQALAGVDFTLKKGEVVSILGYNGSGKTTLSKLLCGGYRQAGGTYTFNGEEITNEKRQRLFAYFGIAPQEYSKFSLPLREFVGLGAIEQMQDEQALKEAYAKMELDPFLARYEERDRVQLGKEYDEKGTDLSGGEWQRLVVASAYFGTPEILLL